MPASGYGLTGVMETCTCVVMAGVSWPIQSLYPASLLIVRFPAWRSDVFGDELAIDGSDNDLLRLEQVPHWKQQRNQCWSPSQERNDLVRVGVDPAALCEVGRAATAAAELRRHALDHF